jgi:hypothetical protein
VVRDCLYREVAASVVESNRDEIARFTRELEASLHEPPPPGQGAGVAST